MNGEATWAADWSEHDKMAAAAAATSYMIQTPDSGNLYELWAGCGPDRPVAAFKHHFRNANAGYIEKVAMIPDEYDPTIAVVYATGLADYSEWAAVCSVEADAGTRTVQIRAARLTFEDYFWGSETKFVSCDLARILQLPEEDPIVSAEDIRRAVARVFGSEWSAEWSAATPGTFAANTAPLNERDAEIMRQFLAADDIVPASQKWGTNIAIFNPLLTH